MIHALISPLHGHQYAGHRTGHLALELRQLLSHLSEAAAHAVERWRFDRSGGVLWWSFCHLLTHLCRVSGQLGCALHKVVPDVLLERISRGGRLRHRWRRPIRLAIFGSSQSGGSSSDTTPAVTRPSSPRASPKASPKKKRPPKAYIAAAEEAQHTIE